MRTDDYILDVVFADVERVFCWVNDTWALKTRKGPGVLLGLTEFTENFCYHVLTTPLVVPNSPDLM